MTLAWFVTVFAWFVTVFVWFVTVVVWFVTVVVALFIAVYVFILRPSLPAHSYTVAFAVVYFPRITLLSRSLHCYHVVRQFLLIPSMHDS